MKRNVSLAALSIAAAVFATGAMAGPEKTSKPQHTTAAASGKTILQTAETAGTFNTLTELLKKSGLDKTLNSTNAKYTVFAPTDEAFKALGTETLANLGKPENSGLLNSILKYHVVLGNVMAADVKTGSVPTFNGQRIDVVANNGKVTVDKANVTKTDIVCANGVIHVVDTVILPNEKDIVATAVSAKLTTLVKLITAADLGKTFMSPGNFTVFAPSDEAFAKLDKATIESLLQPENKQQLVNILKNHVIADGRIFSDAAGKPKQIKTLGGTSLTIESRNGSVYINNAKVVKSDIDTNNGVVHVVDSVLIPDQAGAAATSNPVVGN